MPQKKKQQFLSLRKKEKAIQDFIEELPNQHENSHKLCDEMRHSV